MLNVPTRDIQWGRGERESTMQREEGRRRDRERDWASEAGKQRQQPSLSGMERLVLLTGSGNNNTKSLH